jgi:uncharacterized protein
MRPRRKIVRIGTVLLALCGFAYGLALPQVDKSRFFRPGTRHILLISGRNNHDWRTTTPFLRKQLESTGRFDVRVCEEPAGISGETLAGYDALVLDYCGPRWGESAEKAVEAFVRSGKGMVAVHGASYNFSGLEVLADGHKPTGIKELPWPEFARMVGGYWPGVPEKQFHGKMHTFTVKIVQPGHPAVLGVPPEFQATDELYHQMQFLPGTEVLATAYDDPAYGGTGKEEPMLCAVQYGKGRVFYTALGHEVPAMSAEGFLSSFLRGTDWAAGAAASPAAPGKK